MYSFITCFHAKGYQQSIFSHLKLYSDANPIFFSHTYIDLDTSKCTHTMMIQQNQTHTNTWTHVHILRPRCICMHTYMSHLAVYTVIQHVLSFYFITKLQTWTSILELGSGLSPQYFKICTCPKRSKLSPAN